MEVIFWGSGNAQQVFHVINGCFFALHRFTHEGFHNNTLLSDGKGGGLKWPLRWTVRPSPLEFHHPMGPASGAVVCAYLFPP